MLFQPKWVKMLPADLKPEKKQIKELEKIRAKFKCPHENFFNRIMSSPSTTRKVQKNRYQALKSAKYAESTKMEATEQEILRFVLIARFNSLSAEELDNAMKNINTIDDLCDYVTNIEEQGPALPDPYGIGELVGNILGV